MPYTPGTKFPAAVDTPEDLILTGNGLVTTLTANLAAGGLSCTVANASNWPAKSIATIQKRVAAIIGAETVYLPTGPLEIVNYERVGNTLTLTRAQQGTLDIAHDAGDYIECRITALHHDVPRGAIVAIEGKLGRDPSLPAVGKQLVGTANGGSAWQDRTYRHVQGVAATVWTITHNLACRPSVTVVDSTGTLVIGQVEYLDDNNVRLTFSAAFGGEAYLN